MTSSLPAPKVSDLARSAPQGYLAGLNPEQREAVEALDGPVLVLAGAGTGKTRVLTTRLAHILATGRAQPWQILAVTFTNKAAREMKERIGRIIGPAAESLQWLGTFHSVAAQILRRKAELADLRSNFTILDADDQLRLMKQVIQAEGLDEKRWTARALAVLIDGWKNKGLAPDKVPESERHSFAEGRGVKLYRLYQERLKTLNAVDFGDLLMLNIKIFQENPDVLAEFHDRFRYLLVDEYQDTNVAQYLWLRLLARGSGNLCVVGDDDQCLAEGTLVTMADGTRRPIEQVRAGDLVLSSYGSGDFRPARVTDVFQRSASRPGVRITTAAGRVLESTPEHVHFAGYRLGIVPQTHFVYLMRKDGVGFRLGTSQVYTNGQVEPTAGFEQRLRHEHGDALWILATHDSENEARAQEYELSLRYAIPTLPFVPRKGKSGGPGRGPAHDPAYLKRIFGAFDTATSAERLLADIGLSLDAPHHRPRSRNSSRRSVVVTLCGDRRGKTPMHRVSIVGNDEAGRAALGALGLSVRPAKAASASWRFETVNADFGAVAATVETIGSAMPIDVFRVARLGKQAGEAAETSSLPFTPAAFVRAGMALFAENGEYDIVAKVEPADLRGSVYDLNVERTHNFVANGILTHNSIYGWRGAEVDNILRFEKDFPGAKVIRLERNYRSTAPILAAASGLISANRGRLGKTLWTEAEGGEKVRVRGVWDGEAEARMVAEEIEAWRKEEHPTESGSRTGRWSDCAVLVRAAWQMRAFEDRFLTVGAPYKVIGGPRFFERAEIRDAHAYLRLVLSEDDDLAFERVVNTPKRGIGDSTVQKLETAARAAGTSLARITAQLVQTDEIRGQARTALRTFLHDLDRWREQSRHMRHDRLAELVLDESGYTGMLKEDKSPQAAGRLDNLKELVRSMGAHETLEAYLEHVALVMDLEKAESGDEISLMTLHAAKGLEFPLVFLPGWEETVFPSQRALEDKGVAALEEERRLAYVGLTRARRRVVISFAANRQIYGRWQSVLPSRFVDELPADQVDAGSDTGYFGAASAGYGGMAERMDPYASSYSSPGWARLQKAQGSDRGRRAPPTIEGEARLVAKEDETSSFAPGERVFHIKFGYGRVRAVEGNKLTVDFDKAGQKKVIESFVERA